MSEILETPLGPYDLHEIIHRSEVATIYKAYQPLLDRFAAVKVMTPSEDSQFAFRFRREARAVVQLQHRNIAQLYEYGEHNTLFYLAMQYVEHGRSLRSIMGTPIQPGHALRLIMPILSALGYAHSKGVVHGNITPSTILLADDYWPMLIGFTIASEHVKSRPVDASTDLYALGKIVYEMVTGRTHSEGDTPFSLKADVPRSLEQVLLKALANDSHQRYQTAAEMTAALEYVVNELKRGTGDSQQSVAALYAAGVNAFKEDRWQEAIDHFQRVVVLRPSYEDALDLLAAAREGYERARVEAQMNLHSLRLRDQSDQHQPPPPSSSVSTAVVSVPYLDHLAKHDLPDAVATNHEFSQQSSRIRPITPTIDETTKAVSSKLQTLLVITISVAVLLLVIMVYIWLL